LTEALALVLQPDGKLVAAGSSDAGGTGSDDFILARYLPGGSLDPTFGVGGKVTTDFGGRDLAFTLVLQPDGKLVAAGGSPFRGFSSFSLTRYLPDGSLDRTFGTEGKVITEFGGEEVSAIALVLQPDGKLVAAGQGAFAVTSFDFILARYLPDGSLDPTFGVGGKVTTDFGGTVADAEALILQPDGKLVAAGIEGSNVTGTFDFALARYLPNGSLDPTFGVGGKVTTDFGTGERAGALILQPDGKLVAAGFSEFQAPNNTRDFALARYESLLVLEVAIDIKPDEFPNSINPRSREVIPVAILTTDTFDATTVDPLSITFGPNGAIEAHGRGHIEDVDGDGDDDLVLHFRIQETGIQCGDTSASLTGTTFSGFAIEGSDSIQTVGCK